mgnify:CR=1 FL=1
MIPVALKRWLGMPHSCENPKSIFISAFDSAPLGPDYDFILHGHGEEFQKGLDALAKLTSGKVHLNVMADSLASFKYALLLINSNGEILWKHNYSSNDKLSAAKIEAGIYFIYNEEEEIYLTLSSKGEKIGQ